MNQLRILAVAGVAMVALTGCTGGDPGGRATAAPTPDAVSPLDVANCMRANGHPDFPDPIQDDEGNWTFPDSIRDYEAPQACQELLRNQKASDNERNRRTPEEMAQRRRYSGCMRDKGVPDFPDPDEDGNFPLTDQQRTVDESPPWRTAREACRQYEPPRRNDKPSPTPGAGS